MEMKNFLRNGLMQQHLLKRYLRGLDGMKPGMLFNNKYEGVGRSRPPLNLIKFN